MQGTAIKIFCHSSLLLLPGHFSRVEENFLSTLQFAIKMPLLPLQENSPLVTSAIVQTLVSIARSAGENSLSHVYSGSFAESSVQTGSAKNRRSPKKNKKKPVLVGHRQRWERTEKNDLRGREKEYLRLRLY